MAGARDFVLYVNSAQDLELDGSGGECVGMQVNVSMGRVSAQSDLTRGWRPNPTFWLEKVLRWHGDAEILVQLFGISRSASDRLLGECKVNMRSLLSMDWEGDVTLYRGSRRVGKLNVGVRWMDNDPLPPPPTPPPITPRRNPGHFHEDAKGADVATPRSRAGGRSSGSAAVGASVGRTLPGDMGAFVEHGNLAQHLASIDGEQLRRHAQRLSEVVVQLQAGRREDWLQWRAREATLVEEVEDLKHAALEQAASQSDVHAEINAEYRRRVDADARNTQQERQWQEELRHWGSDARAFEEELRVHKRGHDILRSEEAKKLVSMRQEAVEAHRAKDIAARDREDMARKLSMVMSEISDFDEVEDIMRQAESQALNDAWHLEGELLERKEAMDDLRSELTAATGRASARGHYLASGRSGRDGGSGGGVAAARNHGGGRGGGYGGAFGRGGAFGGDAFGDAGGELDLSAPREALRELRIARARVNDLLGSMPPG